MIDRSGTWWTGESFDDLREYVVDFTAGGYPAGPIVQSSCECGGTVFGLRLDDEEGCAQRRCDACGAEALLADSDEYWDDAEPDDAACPCGGERFELGVGFSLRDDGDVRWVTVAGRCVTCGVLGAYVDWKIDYSPTRPPPGRHLMHPDRSDDAAADDGRLWFEPRVERKVWPLGDGLADCATYRIVGGQRDAFEALRQFSVGQEPVAVDLAGLTDPCGRPSSPSSRPRAWCRSSGSTTTS